MFGCSLSLLGLGGVEPGVAFGVDSECSLGGSDGVAVEFAITPFVDCEKILNDISIFLN